jgi:hypothetical protein
MIGVVFRLEAGLRLGPVFLLGLKWRTIRVPSLSVDWAVGGRMLPKASVMMGCRDAMLIAWGEGLSGRVLRLMRGCPASAVRWKDQLPPGQGSLVLGGAIPRGS